MKHFFNKSKIQGAGKGSKKPQAPILEPPKPTLFSMLNSYSVAEVVDLISDGAIDGLVNQNGELVEGADILQGIYLDNTPIKVTSSSTEGTLNEELISSVSIPNLSAQFAPIYDFTNKKPKAVTVKDTSNKTYAVKDCTVLGGAVTSSYYTLYNTLSQSLLTNSDATPNPTTKWAHKVYNSTTYQHYEYVDATNPVEFHYRYNTHKIDSPILSSVKTALNTVQADEVPEFVTLAKSAIAKLESITTPTDSYINTSLYKTRKFIIYQQIGTRSSPVSATVNSKNESVYQTINGSQAFIDSSISFNGMYIPSSSVYKVIIPKFNSATNKYTGQYWGFIAYVIDIGDQTADWAGNIKQISIPVSIVGSFGNTFSLTVKRGSEYSVSSGKFNYSNVACEFRSGEEFQLPLDYINDIHIDFEYGRELLGSFKTSGSGVERIDGGFMTNGSSNPKIINRSSESSQDIRTPSTVEKNYSEWNKDNSFDELPVPVVHTVENPNVDSVYISLGIQSLSDTLVKTAEGMDAGAKVPTVVNIEVEYGKITNGDVSDVKKERFTILAQVESNTVIDIGCPTNLSPTLEKSVREYENLTSPASPSLNTPFSLPRLNSTESPITTKRYIKVTKLSVETNSVLINKDLVLSKVTEIIENRFSYPFSAIAAVKLDSRTFGSTPERSYDCRLKKIRIPSNYFPIDLSTKKDKRYIRSAKDYTSLVNLYEGDWDGTFKEGWTDNPAWIIFDLLTSKRYGLGGHIDDSQVNIWQLYKIARFCDAVDDNGNFLGVSDGYGGLEPRYSCNIIFREKTKIFDAINVVASLFRGIVFYTNSEISFVDDRPQSPTALFTNSNVKDGIFNYINNRRDQQYNTIEVSYLDRFDNYQAKIEYVENETDIRKRGVFKTQANIEGITSRAMARRVGNHMIYQTIKENQGVEFTAGQEVLLCQAGDLILIEDEMKSRESNYGRVLSIDTTAKTVMIDNTFTSGMENSITMYTPNGDYSSRDISDMISNGELAGRLDDFYLSGTTGSAIANLGVTGYYKFSGYTSGYQEGLMMPTKFPAYTGNVGGVNLFCVYKTEFNGYGFFISRPNVDRFYCKAMMEESAYDANRFKSYSSSNGDLMYGFASNNLPPYRSTPLAAPYSILSQSKVEVGISPDELNNIHSPKITTIGVTGYENFDFGSKLYLNTGDSNINLLNIVSEGSAYRVKRKNTTDQLYKLTAIREINQNEYGVSATKFNTGKYEEIENFIVDDYIQDTFVPPTSNTNKLVTQLTQPVISSFYASNYPNTDQKFILDCAWNAVPNATNYKVDFFNKYSAINGSFTTSALSATYSGAFNSGISVIGHWGVRVQALGNGTTIASLPAETGKFIPYLGSLDSSAKPLFVQFNLN